MWNVGHSIFQKCAFIEHTFLEIFQRCLTRFDRDEMAYFAAIARRIWLRRNSMVFKSISEHLNKTYMDAITVVEDFKRCLKDEKVETSPEQVEGRVPVCWQTPPEGTIKVNFDAAINKNTGFTGLGLTARDHKGYLLGAKCLTKPFLTDAHTAELMAASYAVNFCLEVGLFNVIFEGDALNVIREVNSNPPFLSRSGHFVEGIKQEVHHLRSFAFVHVPRVLNEAAHTLAKSAAATLCDDVWLEATPTCILDIVTREHQVPRS